MDGLSVSICLSLTSGARFCYNRREKNDGKEACRLKKKKKSQIGFRVAAGVMDVFGVALAIVVLLLMLGSLFSWLRQDLAITFADLTDNITDAVIIGK